MTPTRLPHLDGAPMVTDGGLETDLIFHHGVDLPHFAAFPLLGDAAGRDLLSSYVDGYAAIASAAGAGLMLETPTWRANADWGARLGYSPDALDRVNAEAVAFMAGLRERYAGDVPSTVVGGVLGPRGDGYVPDPMDPDEAADYHAPQVRSLAEAGAQLVTALTLTDPGEAIGIARAARSAGIAVALSFTVETDGRLPGGAGLDEAIAIVDAAQAPDYYLVNCAHPAHLAEGLVPGPWRDRVVGLRYNASRRSHAELDEATELDEGDLGDLVRGHEEVSRAFPRLSVLGGCCGTDARHVAALWGQGG